MWVRFVPEQKEVAPLVISTYSYTPVRPKPVPLPVIEQRATEEIQQQTVTPLAQQRATVEVAPEQSSMTASAVAMTPKDSEQKSQPTTGALSLADRALASAAAIASAASSAPDWSMQQIPQGYGSQSTSELTPALLKEVKRYADGSLLVEGAHGCWKVPATELRNGAVWLTTSTPCEADTTVEQITGILQKRRSYNPG